MPILGATCFAIGLPPSSASTEERLPDILEILIHKSGHKPHRSQKLFFANIDCQLNIELIPGIQEPPNAAKECPTTYNICYQIPDR